MLCNAGPGWDGPTGLGTPDGVDALTTGPHGDIAGKVTDTVNGNPIAGATVSATGGYSATTNSLGELRPDRPGRQLQPHRAGLRLQDEDAWPASSEPGADHHGELRPGHACPAIPSPARSPTDPGTGGRSTPRSPSAATRACGVHQPVHRPATASPAQRAARTRCSVTPVYPGYNTDDRVGAHRRRRRDEEHQGHRWTRPPARARGTPTSTTGPPRSSPAGPAPRPRTAGPSSTTWATARPGSSAPTRTGEGAPPDTDGQFAIADSDHYRPATARTPRWSRRWSTCPATPRP